MNIEKYQYKEEWERRSKLFVIVVCRWSYVGSRKNNWNIYCYIFPEHPLFKTLIESTVYSPPIDFHGGCTYFKWFRNEQGEVTSKQYGCDYSHYGDESFDNYMTPEQASEVFYDAEELFRFLSEEDETK